MLDVRSPWVSGTAPIVQASTNLEDFCLASWSCSQTEDIPQSPIELETEQEKDVGMPMVNSRKRIHPGNNSLPNMLIIKGNNTITGWDLRNSRSVYKSKEVSELNILTDKRNIKCCMVR